MKEAERCAPMLDLLQKISCLLRKRWTLKDVKIAARGEKMAPVISLGRRLDRSGFSSEISLIHLADLQ